MPRLVYKPEGADPKSWPFNPDKMLSSEVMLIERQTGMTFIEWGQALGAGSMTALHAALWVLLRRDMPDLDPEAVVFSMDDIDIEGDPAPAPKGQKKVTKPSA